MKLVTFDAGDGALVGAVAGDGSIVDLAAAAPASARPLFASVLSLVEGGDIALDDDSGRQDAVTLREGRREDMPLVALRDLDPPWGSIRAP